MSDVAQCPLCEKYIDITIKPTKCIKCEADLKDYNLSPQVHKTSAHSGRLYGLIVAVPIFCIVGFIAGFITGGSETGWFLSFLLAAAVYKGVDKYFDKREEKKDERRKQGITKDN